MTVRRSKTAATGALLAAAVGAFGSLDTALNIAFPDLVADFDLTVGQLQWVVICFVAASGGLLVPAGALGDRIGHATTVVAGAVVAAVGLVTCALAPSFGWFLGGRVVQGVGTATLMASAPALATLAAPASGRARAVGVFQSATAVGLASGPIVGGLFVLLMGWRGVFWFRVPLAVALLVLAMRARGSGRPVVEPRSQPAWRAVVTPTVVVASVATFVGNGAMFATWLLVPTLLVDMMGVELLLGGVVLAVSPALTALAAGRAGAVSERLGPAFGAVVGLAVMVAGMVVVATAGDGRSIALVVVGLALVGAGLGLFSVPNMAVVMAALPPSAQGVAGGLNLMTRTGGIVAGAAWHARLFDRLEPASGFATAFGVVFAVGAAAIASVAVLVGLAAAPAASRLRRRPSSA